MNDPIIGDNLNRGRGSLLRRNSLGTWLLVLLVAMFAIWGLSRFAWDRGDMVTRDGVPRATDVDNDLDDDVDLDDAH